MIPAILSCVFVVYLYQKLHSESLGANAKSNSSIGSAGLTESRLANIESRLELLTKRSKG